MPEEITCPVCGLESIPADRVKCPQCDADLTCFKVLSSLPDEPLKEKNIRGTGLPAGVVIVLFIGLIAVILTNQFYWFAQFKTLFKDQQLFFSDSMRIMSKTLEHLAQGQAAPEVIKPEGNPEQTNFRTYRVKVGDTLWSISKRYYGTGHYYPLLLEHNPHLGIYTIPIGSKINILTDAEHAKHEYSRIIMREGDKTYWNYTVTEGDTLESLALKFYKNENGAERIFNLNPKLKLKAGENIKILLK